MKMKSLKTVLAAATLISVASSASAAEMASGEEIRAHVSGNTVQGSMLRDTFQKYSEFYMGDGTIRGDGYTGKWSISGDTMCFEYGGESSGCWGASIEGAAIIWWKDGAVDGAAVANAGNGNEY
jgi:hypothetical protein